MESPAYLVDQFAKSRGVSANNAKRAMMMQTYAEEGKSLTATVHALGISRDTGMMICRRFLIDFPDYRPFASKEKKGEARPEPYIRECAPASGLPIFAALTQ